MSALRLYLEANGLLLASYFLFALGSRLIRLMGARSPHLPLLRWAQALILVSLLTPIGFHFLPNPSLPKASFGVFHTIPEQAEKLLKTQVQIQAQKTEASHTAAPKPYVPRPREISLFTLSLLWSFGAIFLLIRLALNLLGVFRSTRDATLIRRLDRIRIAVSDSVSVPFSVRLGRIRWVILPLPIFQNRRDLRIALSHELQHHRQGDTLWAIAYEILVCAFFANPATYLWKKEVTELQEFSCDEALIGQKGVSSHEYGSCLVRVAEAALGNREMYVGTTCMASISRNPFYFKSLLRRRIEMFENHARRKSPGWGAAALGTLAALLTVALAFGSEESLRNRAPINPGTAAVDPAIQEIAEKALAHAVKTENAKAGFAIVADPNTGKILAIANIDTTQTMTGHWALSQILEPASLAKTLVAAEAIESGLTTPDERLSCENGNFKFGDHVYHDWKKSGWDHLTTQETIMLSSDICAMKLGQKLGTDGLQKMLTQFGFGPGGVAKTFPEARAGFLPPEDDPKHPLLVPYVSAGFGFRATPLELIQAYGAIANGGNLMTPSTADSSQPGPVIRRVLTPASADKMKEILRQVVVNGTGKGHANSRLYSTAGKTATSYIPDLTEWELVKAWKTGNFAGFIGFAPVKDPRVEVYVGIRDPHTDETGAHGSTHAAPVFKEITESVLKYMNVAPDLPQG